MTRILGVDPGTRIAGWGVVEKRGSEVLLVAADVIRAPEGAIGERLRVVHEAVSRVIREHSVAVVAVEEAYFGKNARSAIRLGEGRAVAILAAAQAGLPVLELAASLVKKAVVGHGAATKDQVRAAVEAILAGAREATAALPPDATDALALALAGHARATSAPGRRKRSSRWTAADLERLGIRVEDEHG